MKTDLRQEAIKLRHSWIQEKAMLEEALDRVQAGFAHVSASTPKETIERALVLQKSILKHIEDRERSVRTSELECVLKNRSSAVVESYLVLASRFLFLDLATYGITALEDLKGLDLFTQSSNQAIGSTQKGSRINPKNYQWDVDPFQLLDSEDGNTTQMPAGHLINEESLCLQAVLTDWQNVAAHTIETELLAPRRIGSLCFLSSETALLAMKLASMVRIGLINPSARRTKIVLRLLEIWRQFWRKNFRIEIRNAFLRPAKIVELFHHSFDALFLDYAILSSWTQQYPSTYPKIICELAEKFPFLILLLTQSQLAHHQDLLKNMIVETYSLLPPNTDPNATFEEEVSSLLIVRQQSRYILHYARDPWDVIVRDFGWNSADSLEQFPANSEVFPNPYHLSEKILLASNFALRTVSTSIKGDIHSTWLTQRESACWRKFGGQIPELPRLFSENRTSNEWKIVLQLPEGNWSFARCLQSADILLAQMQCLLQTLAWLRKQSVFLNNLRFDTLAVSGPKICLLSLDRLDSQETEDTISALLWLWYDLGRIRIPVRPWPINPFPNEKLSEIPEPLKEMSEVVAASPSLDHFFQNFLASF